MYVTWQARQQKVSLLSQGLYRATYLAVKGIGNQRRLSCGIGECVVSWFRGIREMSCDLFGCMIEEDGFYGQVVSRHADLYVEKR